MALTDSPPTTTNYSITLPEVGKDRNSWGGILNSALQDLEDEIYSVDTVFGEVSDSVTPSLAYKLDQADSNASTALTNSNTAVSVATKMVNASLVGLLSDLDTLETDLASAEAQLAASAAELQTLQETADEALADAQAARTAAEAALAAWSGS
jgi:multidrug resistance efflux pump